MAEDLSNIFESYENKSIEELGSSLLSRQAAINEKRAKEAKKSKKIGQALAVIGVGQQLFKNAYNKRMKEADKHELFLLSNQENQAKQVQQFGRIMEYMPEKEWAEKNKDLDIDSKVKLYFEEYDGDGLSKRFSPMIDTLIKQDFKTDQEFAAFKANTNAYNTTYDAALHEVLKDYLSIDDKTGQAKYLGFENEMRELFNMPETDFDAIDVFQRARGIKPYDLTQAEKRIINENRLKYRNRGVMNTIKDGLSQIGLIQQDKGGINVFKSIDQTQLPGGNFNDVLNSLELGGLVIGAVDKNMGRYRKTFDVFTDEVKGDPKLYERAALNLDSFNQRIQNRRIYDSDNKYKMTIGYRAWDNYTENILDDETQKDEWVTDIGALSLAFQKDIDFAERVYRGGLENKGIEYTEDDIKEFRKNVSTSEQYRFDIATAITAQFGFKAGGAKKALGIPYWSEAEYYDPDTDEIIYEEYRYDRNNGPIPGILGEGITFNQKQQKYVTDKNWESMDIDAKKNSFDLRVNQIAKSTVPSSAKLLMFQKLFDEIPNPYNYDYAEYMMVVAPDFIQELTGF